MKGYAEASKFPLTEIAGRKIPRVVLGQHPYDGITYTSPERDQQYVKRWTAPERMVAMMKPIVQRYGLTASREVPSETDLSRWHRQALRMTMEQLGTEIALVLGTSPPTNVSPDVTGYLYRLSLRLAGQKFARSWRGDPIVHYGFKRNKATDADLDQFARKATRLSIDPPSEWKSVEVDYERLDATLNLYRDFNILAYASNANFELLVLSRRFDELQKIADLIRARIGNFFLGTHYAGLIIPMVEEAGVRVDGYLTPINAAGIYMFPSQQLAIEAIEKTGKPAFAIKPLGGGRVPPREAFRYLFRKINIPVTMVGVGGVEEARETFTAAKEALKAPN